MVLRERRSSSGGSGEELHMLGKTIPLFPPFCAPCRGSLPKNSRAEINSSAHRDTEEEIQQLSQSGVGGRWSEGEEVSRRGKRRKVTSNLIYLAGLIVILALAFARVSHYSTYIIHPRTTSEGLG